MQGVSGMILTEDGLWCHAGSDRATLLPILTEMGAPLMPTRNPTPVSIVELGKKLLIAAKNGDTEEVRELMAKGAPFTTDWLGTSPLHFAALHNHLDTCEVLLRAGISRDARTKVDRTPLHMAAYEGHTAIVDSLILNGADVDAKDMLKMTPLHWAVQNEHSDVIVTLLRHGANPDIVNKFEKTPVDIAVDLNRMDLLQQLQCITKDPLMMNHDPCIELSGVDEAAIEKIQPHITDEDHQTEDISISSVEDTTPITELKYTTVNNLVHNKHIENNIEEHETMDMSDSMEILKEHGISFLPNDESSVVASAVENGHSLVLTEVGKQVLNSTKPFVKIPVQKAPMPAKLKGRKVVTVTTEQLLAMVGQKNGIFKKLPSGIVSLSEKPIKRSVVMNKNKIIIGGLNAQIKKKPDFNQPDIESIRRQLAEARQQAEEYKQMLKRKEAEAERYKRQLQSITQGK